MLQALVYFWEGILTCNVLFLVERNEETQKPYTPSYRCCRYLSCGNCLDGDFPAKPAQKALPRRSARVQRRKPILYQRYRGKQYHWKPAFERVNIPPHRKWTSKQNKDVQLHRSHKRLPKLRENRDII